MAGVKEKTVKGRNAKENRNEAKLNCFECSKPHPVRKYVCRRGGHGYAKIHAVYPKELNGKAGKPGYRTACAPPKNDQLFVTAALRQVRIISGYYPIL